jgi:hypothetical protein
VAPQLRVETLRSPRWRGAAGKHLSVAESRLAVGPGLLSSELMGVVVGVYAEGAGGCSRYRRLAMTVVATTRERATSAPTAASQLMPVLLRTWSA